MPGLSFPLLLALATLTTTFPGRMPAHPATDSTRTIMATWQSLDVRPDRVGIPARPACGEACGMLARPVVSQDSTSASAARGKYAWWGLAVGAAAGWFAASRACGDDDCYSASGGIMLAAAGGVLGLIVGLLVSP